MVRVSKLTCYMNWKLLIDVLCLFLSYALYINIFMSLSVTVLHRIGRVTRAECSSRVEKRFRAL
jgi:hypothetical protein